MFWKRKHEQEIQIVVERATQSLSEQLNRVQATLSEQSDALTEQVNKLGRLQYKTSHDVVDRLQKLMTGLDALVQRQAQEEQLAEHVAALKQQVQSLVVGIIPLIDDLDVLRDGLKGEAQRNWGNTLNQWTQRLLMQLNEVGVREVPVVGITFDPRFCESVGTVDLAVAASQSKPSYEVVKVVRRGFVQANGDVLRKSQVITINSVSEKGQGKMS